MKTIKLARFCAVIGLLGLVPSLSFAQDAIDRVRIEVRVESDQDRKDVPKSNADTVTQSKTLQIAISGKPKAPETRTGKWEIFGRMVKNRSLVVVDSGVFPIDLPEAGQQRMESKAASTTYTPEHSVSSGNGRRAKFKKVEAEGMKYAGYRVVVSDGQKVVGGLAEPMSLMSEPIK